MRKSKKTTASTTPDSSHLTLLEAINPDKIRDERVLEEYGKLGSCIASVTEIAEMNPQKCWEMLFYASDVMRYMARIIRAEYDLPL